MSVLGDFVRLSPALLEEIRAVPETAYLRMTGEFGAPERLELDWEWRPYAGLFDAAGFPLNPVSSGSPYPDERSAFGAEGDAHSLSVLEVVQAADLLSRTPFEVLEVHLRAVLEDQATVTIDYDYTSPGYHQPLAPEKVVRPHLPDDLVHDRRVQLAERYGYLVAFFRAAADRAASAPSSGPPDRTSGRAPCRAGLYRRTDDRPVRRRADPALPGACAARCASTPALGFQAEDLDGYAVLRDGTTEHLWQASYASSGGCQVRVPDAAALWQELQGQEVLGPLDDDNPAMLSFAVLGPDRNHLVFLSGR